MISTVIDGLLYLIPWPQFINQVCGSIGSCLTSSGSVSGPSNPSSIQNPCIYDDTVPVVPIRSKPEFDCIIASAESLVVVDFYATWCAPCRAIAPELQKMASIYKDVLFLKVDVDQNADTADEAGVSALPTFQFYKDGRLVDVFQGPNRAALEEKIKQLK